MRLALGTISRYLGKRPYTCAALPWVGINLPWARSGDGLRRADGHADTTIRYRRRQQDRKTCRLGLTLVQCSLPSWTYCVVQQSFAFGPRTPARSQNADCRSPEGRIYDISPAAAVTGLCARHVYPRRWRRGKGCRADGFFGTNNKMPPWPAEQTCRRGAAVGLGGKRAVIAGDTRQQVGYAPLLPLIPARLGALTMLGKLFRPLIAHSHPVSRQTANLAAVSGPTVVGARKARHSPAPQVPYLRCAACPRRPARGWDRHSFAQLNIANI